MSMSMSFSTSSSSIMFKNGAASVISSSDTVKGFFQFPCPVGKAFGFEDVAHVLRIS